MDVVSLDYNLNKNMDTGYAFLSFFTFVALVAFCVFIVKKCCCTNHNDVQRMVEMQTNVSQITANVPEAVPHVSEAVLKGHVSEPHVSNSPHKDPNHDQWVKEMQFINMMCH